MCTSTQYDVIMLERYNAERDALYNAYHDASLSAIHIARDFSPADDLQNIIGRMETLSKTVRGRNQTEADDILYELYRLQSQFEAEKKQVEADLTELETALGRIGNA